VVADILLAFPIKAPPLVVFDAMTSPDGLNSWWTLDALGEATLGASYALGFGLATPWRALVTRCERPFFFEWTMLASDADWVDTRVGIQLSETAFGTQVEFYHRGWRTDNEHFRGSSYCWATYLRILKRSVELGEFIPYHQRDDA